MLVTDKSMKTGYNTIINQYETPKNIRLLSIVESKEVLDFIKILFQNTNTSIRIGILDEKFNSISYIVTESSNAGDLVFVKNYKNK